MIVWVASYPKSGNTWLRLLLAAWFRRKPVGINQLTAAGFGMTDAHGPFLPTSSYTHEDIAPHRLKVQKHIAAQEGTAFIKTHTAYALVNGVPTIDPGSAAGVIYVVRDPRDVALSYAPYFNVSIDDAIAAMARINLTIHQPQVSPHTLISSWSQNVESWRNQEEVPKIMLRYEDLLADTAQTFRYALDFLKQPEDDERLEVAVKAAQFERVQKQEEEQGFIDKVTRDQPFFRRGTAGHWRDELTAEQAAKIVEVHGETMGIFGYE